MANGTIVPPAICRTVVAMVRKNSRSVRSLLAASSSDACEKLILRSHGCQKQMEIARCAKGNDQRVEAASGQLRVPQATKK